MTLAADQAAFVQNTPRLSASRQRRAEVVTDRVRRDGKFFRLGNEKFYVKGVTYGPFAQSREGVFLPERQQVRARFRADAELGANCLRIYHVPPALVSRPRPGNGAEDLSGRQLAKKSDVLRRSPT